MPMNYSKFEISLGIHFLNIKNLKIKNLLQVFIEMD